MRGAPLEFVVGARIGAAQAEVSFAAVVGKRRGVLAASEDDKAQGRKAQQ